MRFKRVDGTRKSGNLKASSEQKEKGHCEKNKTRQRLNTKQIVNKLDYGRKKHKRNLAIAGERMLHVFFFVPSNNWKVVKANNVLAQVQLM